MQGSSMGVQGIAGPPRALFRLTVSLLLVALTSSYTVNDLHRRCTPCPAQLKLSHPTKCNLYLLCNHFSLSWEEAKCSAHAYFNGVDRCQAATISNRTCPYDITAVANLDIQDVRKCAVQGTDPPTVTAGTRPQNGTGGTKASVVPTKPGGVIATTPLAQDMSHKTTVILAVLLALTFLVLILVVIGIFLYRRRQRRRRPKNFYSRKLPPSTNTKESAALPTGNAAYLSRSLLHDTDSNVDAEMYEVPMSEEPGYMEIPERSSQAYYSEPDDNPRPPMPLPGEIRDSDIYESAYAENTLPEYTVSHSEEGDNDNTYTSPDDSNPSANNHIYCQSGGDSVYTRPDALNIEDPYHYSKPVTANPTPTPSFRGADDLSTPRPASRPATPESPPYYVDPIPEVLAANTTHQYHTLEPLLKKTP